MDFLYTMMSGIIGGMILNVMPCVIPALFSKAYHIIRLNEKSNHEKLANKKLEELFFLLGILVTFSILATFVIILRNVDRSFAWGMQLRNPIFVAILIIATYLFAISNFGMLNLNLGFTYRNQASQRFKPFFEGVFITLISTPCTAPILGTAINYALSQECSAIETILLFWSIGLGLALPSLSFTFIPQLAKIVPKPGRWSDYFKTFVSYTLIAAAIWLLNAYYQLVDRGQFISLLSALCAITLFLHLRVDMSSPFKDENQNDQYDQQGNAISFLSTHSAFKSFFYVVSSILIAYLLSDLYPIRKKEFEYQAQIQANHLIYETFEEAKLNAYLASNRPVFVYFRSNTCLNCDSYEMLYLNTESMVRLVDDTKIVVMKADLSPEFELFDVPQPISNFLKKYIPSMAVPTYILFSPDGKADVLPEGKPSSLADKIKALSVKYPVSQMKNIQPIK